MEKLQAATVRPFITADGSMRRPKQHDEQMAGNGRLHTQRRGTPKYNPIDPVTQPSGVGLARLLYTCYRAYSKGLYSLARAFTCQNKPHSLKHNLQVELERHVLYVIQIVFEPLASNTYKIFGV